MALEAGEASRCLVREVDEGMSASEATGGGASGRRPRQWASRSLGATLAGALLSATVIFAVARGSSNLGRRGLFGLVDFESMPNSVVTVNNLASSTLPPGLNPCAAHEHIEAGSCVPNQCICHNGEPPKEQEECTKHGGTRCVSCTVGYHLVMDLAGDSVCWINECNCANGIKGSGEDCKDNGASSCQSCDGGYRLYTNTDGESVCRTNECTCENGKGATGQKCQEHATASCASCNDGYHPEETTDGVYTCQVNECLCENGEGATGEGCASHGFDLCLSCEDGYALSDELCLETPAPPNPTCADYEHLEDGACVPNVCTCVNGFSSEGSEGCTKDGGALCVTCKPGYHLATDEIGKNVCAENWCQCENGAPTTGSECLKQGVSDCDHCDSGYHMATDEIGLGVCSLNECVCETGIPGTGVKCEVDGASSCVSCDTGYHLEEVADGVTDCLANTCTCENGAPATGSECEDDGATSCKSCDDDYRLVLQNGASVCLPSSWCKCDNGAPPPGDCEVPEGSHCNTCNAGFHIVRHEWGDECKEDA